MMRRHLEIHKIIGHVYGSEESAAGPGPFNFKMALNHLKFLRRRDQAPVRAIPRQTQECRKASDGPFCKGWILDNERADRV
jgi:hypothetical protein